MKPYISWIVYIWNVVLGRFDPGLHSTIQELEELHREKEKMKEQFMADLKASGDKSEEEKNSLVEFHGRTVDAATRLHSQEMAEEKKNSETHLVRLKQVCFILCFVISALLKKYWIFRFG